MSAHTEKPADRAFFLSWISGLPENLHLIFLLLAAPLAAFLALWTPPFQSADEPAHFFRAYQIAQGHFYGSSGTYVDTGIVNLYDCVRGLPFNTNARFTAANRARAESVKWTGKNIWIEFPNTSVYEPAGYFPQALGIAIGKAAGLGVLRTFELARLLNGAFVLFVCTFSLYWCRGGKVLMFAVLMLPMTLSLFASCSQDATLIALTCMAFGVVSRQIAVGAPLSPAYAALLAISILIASLGRPPYAALLLVLLTPGLLPRLGGAPSWLTGLALASILAAVTVGWWLAASASTGSLAHPDTTNGVVDARAQLQNLLHHPGIIVTLAGYVADHAFQYIAGMIGILGWLDTQLPAPYYFSMMFVLLAACVAETAGGSRVRKRITVLLLASPLIATGAIFFVEYLIWTPVGAAGIFGIQGRYWIPLAIAAGVGLPQLSNEPKIYRRATAIVVLSQLLTILCLPQTILARYYS